MQQLQNKKNIYLMRRIKFCRKVKEIWNCTKNVIKTEFNLNLENRATVFDLLTYNLKNKKEKEHTLIWYINVLMFLLLHSKNLSPEELKNISYLIGNRIFKINLDIKIMFLFF